MHKPKEGAGKGSSAPVLVCRALMFVTLKMRALANHALVIDRTERPPIRLMLQAGRYLACGLSTTAATSVDPVLPICI
jgi:hypothetical protein